MNILHISAAGINSGAGKATFLTHEALLKIKSINSKVLFLENHNLENQIFSVSKISRFYKFKRILSTFLDRSPLFFYKNKRNMLFSSGLFGLEFKKLDLFSWADIIHIHWSNHGLIDILDLKKWGKPVVWTLRDMWLFTGGCHYSLSCNKYINNCNQCHILNSKTKFDLSTYCFNRKKRILSNTKINLVAISTWIQKKANESLILNGYKSELIYSGIRTDIFSPILQTKARLELGIPLDSKVILIGSTSLTDEYKGANYIKSILEFLDDEIVLLTFGNANGFDVNNNKIKIINLGYISNDILLSKIYSCANMFFAPSINEAFGKTLAEAQSCGIPVLCFSETGPADIVEHLITGYTAKFNDYLDLQNGLKFCLNNIFDSHYIRERTIKLFDINISAKYYSELYIKIHSDSISNIKLNE
jgi:glycosyltransferase involved in cell wall biosynthesis